MAWNGLQDAHAISCGLPTGKTYSRDRSQRLETSPVSTTIEPNRHTSRVLRTTCRTHRRPPAAKKLGRNLQGEGGVPIPPPLSPVRNLTFSCHSLVNSSNIGLSNDSSTFPPTKIRESLQLLLKYYTAVGTSPWLTLAPYCDFFSTFPVFCRQRTPAVIPTLAKEARTPHDGIILIFI